MRPTDNGHVVLTLFVAGGSNLSQRAIANVERVCEEALGDDYELEIVDISADPGAAEENRVVAVPTLLKRSPLPVVRLVGDMSYTDRVLDKLNIAPAPP